MQRSLCAALLITASSPVLALENYFNTTAVTLQQGRGFEVGDDRRTILTLEHASAWNWGDVYAFYDRVRGEDSDREDYYMEVSPRFSLGNLGLDASGGIVKDVLIATTYERGQGGFEAWLIGPGVTFEVPWFSHLEANLYYRDTRGLHGQTWQVTIAWSLPFATGPVDWVFDGYWDIRGEEDGNRGDSNFNPQLKIDIGKFFGQPKIVYAGIEYYNWNTKFGIPGVNENTVTPLIQARFSF